MVALNSSSSLRSYVAAVLQLAFFLFYICNNVSVHGFTIASREGPIGRRLENEERETHPSSRLDVATFNVPINADRRKVSPALLAKKEGDECDDGDGDLMGVFKKSPGAAIVAPFVLIFGLDLLLNIAVVTKRSLEVLFTGEYTVWTPWQ